MAEQNGHTTGNVPIEGIDPGGTHKAPGGDAANQTSAGKERPKVQSGDRNTAPNPSIHDSDTVQER